MDPPPKWPERLWSDSHHWHFIGADNAQITLSCCSCAYTVVIDSPEHEWLRFSLMEGPNLVGKGRGLLMGHCLSGSRRLALDGFELSGCSFVEGEYGMLASGLVQYPCEKGERHADHRCDSEVYQEPGGDGLH